MRTSLWQSRNVEAETQEGFLATDRKGDMSWEGVCSVGFESVWSSVWD